MFAIIGLLYESAMSCSVAPSVRTRTIRIDFFSSRERAFSGPSKPALYGTWPFQACLHGRRGRKSMNGLRQRRLPALRGVRAQRRRRIDPWINLSYADTSALRPQSCTAVKRRRLCSSVRCARFLIPSPRCGSHYGAA